MAVRIWLWVSVLASVAGWGLSGAGQLNRTGYAVVIVAALLGFTGRSSGWWGRRGPPRGSARRGCRPVTGRAAISRAWRRLRRRLRRPLPCCFAALGALVLLGGLLYPPTNHTALTYRIPRVLHWLAEGRWHWIHTISPRLNDRACGIEWLSAPLLLFTKSDRTLFLLNFVPFLLLPGLIFSVFSRLGVRPRVAWHWMWLVPTGYTFLLQAGSAANDAFPTVYALAAVDFGCRAWVSRRPDEVWLSLLSAALLTGAKASNLPLLLPWAILVAAMASRGSIPAGRIKVGDSSCRPRPSAVSSEPVPEPRRKGRLAATGGVLLLAATVSFLPTAALNLHYCGDWSGLRLERAGMKMKNPWVGLWGNALLLLFHNLVPPFFPAATWWNRSALSLLPPALARPLEANFENGFQQVKELPTEDRAGFGFGLSVLVLVSLLAGLAGARGTKFRVLARLLPATRRSMSRPEQVAAAAAPVFGREALPSRLRWCVMVAAWVALGVYCAKSGMQDMARLISPYYPLLLPLLLLNPRQSELVRRGWWRVMAGAALGLALLVLVLTPARPLWPAQAVLSRALASHPGQPLLARALEVYTVYAARSDPLAHVRALLPPGLSVVGFLADGNDIDISLWRPYFQRRVEHVLLAETGAAIRQRHIRYLVVGGAFLASQHTTLADWQRRTGADLVASTTATLQVTEGPQSWHVVRLRD